MIKRIIADEFPETFQVICVIPGDLVVIREPQIHKALINRPKSNDVWRKKYFAKNIWRRQSRHKIRQFNIANFFNWRKIDCVPAKYLWARFRSLLAKCKFWNNFWRPMGSDAITENRSQRSMKLNSGYPRSIERKFKVTRVLNDVLIERNQPAKQFINFQRTFFSFSDLTMTLQIDSMEFQAISNLVQWREMRCSL